MKEKIIYTIEMSNNDSLLAVVDRESLIAVEEDITIIETSNVKEYMDIMRNEGFKSISLNGRDDLAFSGWIHESKSETSIIGEDEKDTDELYKTLNSAKGTRMMKDFLNILELKFKYA